MADEYQKIPPISDPAAQGTQTMLQEKSGAPGEVDPNLNQDAFEGNVQMEKNRMLADAQAERDRLAAEKAAGTTPLISSTSDQAKSEDDATGEQVGAATAAAATGQTGLASQSQQAFDRGFQMLNDAADRLEADRKSGISAIEEQARIQRADKETAQRMETGASSMGLARMGGYLGGTGAGLSYMNSLSQSHRLEIDKLEMLKAQAIEAAKAAYDGKEIEAAKTLMDKAKDYQTAIDTQRSNALEQAKFALELRKYERMEYSDIIKDMAKSGVKPPDDYLLALDKEMGYSPGTTSGLFSVSQEETAIAKLKSQAELSKSQAEIDQIYGNLENQYQNQRIAVQKLLQTMPKGQSFTFDGKTYFGSFEGDQQTYYEVDEGTGNAVGFVYNKTYGTWDRQDLGFAGRKQDGWDTEVDTQGKMWRRNKMTGQLIPFEYGATTKSWEQAIPTGTVWDNDGKRTANIGQCGAFANDLTGIGVGDTLESKTSKIDPTIGQEAAGPAGPEGGNVTNNPVQIGDVIVQRGVKSPTWTGHVSIISDMKVDGEGKHWFKLTESNANGDLKVTHDRWIAEDDPMIVGFARGNLDSRLFSGSDYPTFPVKETGTTKNPIIRVKGQDRYGFNIYEEYDPASNTWISTESPEKVDASYIDATDTYSKAVNGAVEKLTGTTNVSTQKYAMRRDVAEAMASGSPINVVEKVKSIAKDSMGQSEKDRLVGAETVLKVMPTVKKEISDYIEAGGDMNVFVGTLEEVAAKLGGTLDPRLRTLNSLIQTYLMDYRRSTTGMAFSQYETDEYKSILPGIKDTKELADAKLDGFINAKKQAVDATYELLLGDDNWPQIREIEEKGYQNIITSTEFEKLVNQFGMEKAKEMVVNKKAWVVELPK